MSDFTFEYNDLRRILSVLNLTDEQIQELMSTLLEKRSAKKKLSTEENLFHQYCREHRSYANNQDT